MSAVAGSRSIAYSADSAGRAGRIACAVVCNHNVADGHVGYSIVVRNDTSAEAQAFAFVPDTLDLRHATIVQSVVGPHSDFSTTFKLEVSRYGGTPELHVELTGEDIAFSLIVPSPDGDRESVEAGAPRLALAALGSSTIVAARSVPHLTLLPAARPAGRAPRFDVSDAAYGVRQRPPEPVRRGPARTSPAALPTFLAFVVVVIAVGFGLLRPQVNALVVPAQAPPGTRIAIAYRATGLGAATYRVVDPDANLVASGPLATGSGTFAITLPKERTARAYLVRVGISGVFGSALAEDYLKLPAVAIPAAITPLAPRIIAPPQIRSLALDRAALAGGDTLTVYYDVAATSGTVELLDAASQIAYGKSPLSPAGHSAFVAPIFDSERFLSVVVSARRGGATAQSRVAVTVSPQSSPAPQAQESGTGVPPSDTSANIVPVIVAPTTVRSAQAIRVDVHDAVAGLVLVLSDGDGAEVARREFSTASAVSSTTFIAPRVKAAVRLRLQATYPQGAGSETTVKTIDVRPR